METCPKVQMVSFDTKLCNYDGPPITEKIAMYISSHYQERPESFMSEINSFLLLRECAVTAPRDFLGLNTMKKYYRQLQFLSNRFPMKAGEACEAEFSWECLYNDKEIIHNDVRYELACMLYNIGATHSYLGCLDKRHTDEGIKISCTHFQYAAWAFQTIKEQYAQINLSSDINEFVMKFNIDMMLAQAQECVLEKSIVENRKHSINAKICAQATEYYKMCLKTCSDSNFSESVGFRRSHESIKHCEYKISYTTAITSYYSSLFSAEQGKHGEAVGYIQLAETKLNECLKMKYTKEFTENLKAVIECVDTKSKLFKKDNDFVYHEKIIAPENLPEVKGVSLVKPLQIDFEKDPDVAIPDIFARLISMKVHELSSLYSEEKAKLSRTIISQKEEKDSQLEQFMTALQIDQLHLDNMDHFKLPKRLLECCAAISVRPKLAKEELPQIMKQIIDVSLQIKTQLDDIEEMLQNEHDENKAEKRNSGESLSDSSDSQSDDDEGKTYTNIKSKKSPKKMKMREILDRYDLLLKRYNEGNASNTALHEAFNSVINNLKVLSLPVSEITEKLPVIEEINDEESKVVRDKLVTLLAKVKEMKDQRDELSKRFLRAIQEDDLTKVIASHQNEIDENANEFFKTQLKKHEQLMSYLLQNIQAQDNILRALAESNASFTSDKQKILDATKARNSFIDNLIFSYESVSDLMEKGKKGVAYFVTLNEPVKKLYDEVKDFCFKSKQERENKIKLMQRVAAVTNNSQQDSPVNINNYRPKTIATMPQNDNFNNSILMNNHNNSQQPQLQHQPTPPLNASDITQLMSTMGVGGERPKLKDFLPFMKPKSSSGVTRRSGGGGPPQIDRNLANFANAAAVATSASNLINNNNNNAPPQFNQITNAQLPQHQQYNHPQVSSTPTQFTTPNNNPTYDLQQFQQNHQMAYTQQQQQQQHGQVNMGVHNKINPPYPPQQVNHRLPLEIANSQPVVINQNIQHNQQQLQLQLQQQQFQIQQQRLAEEQRFAEEQRLKREFDLNQRKQIEQQIKEKELELKRQQLEQQEQQLKLQQQQMQQQQQMMLLQQQQQQQQQLQQQQQQHNQKQNWAPASHPQQTNNGPAPFINPLANFTPQVQQIQNHQPAAVISNPTNMQVNSLQHLQQPIMTQPQQQLPPKMPQAQPLHFSLNQTAVLPPQSSQMNLNSKQPQNDLSEKINPDSVYKPGYFNNIKMNLESNSLPQQQQQQQFSNFQQNSNQIQINSTSQNTFTSQILTPPTAPQQKSNSQITSQQIIIPQSQMKPFSQQKPKQPSAIDDLFDIFDSNNIGLNLAQSTPVVLQPFKIEVFQHNKENNSNNTNGTSQSKNINNNNNISYEKTSNVQETINDNSNTNYHINDTSNNSLTDVSSLSHITNTSPNSTSIITQTNGHGAPVLTAKRLNFINNSAKLERFVNEVNKFENHVNSLSKKTLATSMTILEKEWKELQDYQEKQATSSALTISIARCYPNKNRFQDLLPYDQTRVILQNKSNQDYINATHIGNLIDSSDTNVNDASNGASLHPNFIISQLPFTNQNADLFDFWSMILQQKIELIVCLCRENEFNHQYYWPTSKQTSLNIFSLKVTLQSIKETSNSTQRIFTIENTIENLSRTVVILQQNIKNTHGLNEINSTTIDSTKVTTTGIGLNELPENVSTFLKFVKECENYFLTQQRNRSHPILVHCMNGVSRSAVFILIYSMIQIIDNSSGSSLSQTSSTTLSSEFMMKLIKTMRSKRKYMIQSIYHLKYSYDALLYYMKDILIKDGVLTNSSFNQAQPIMHDTHSQGGNLVLGEQKLNHMRKESIDIIKDESLLSIQSSKDQFCTNLNQISTEKKEEEVVQSLETLSTNESQRQTASLIELCDPKKFSLKMDDESSKKKCNKITKKDFLNNSFQSNLSSIDPFSLLDSLKK